MQEQREIYKVLSIQSNEVFSKQNERCEEIREEQDQLLDQLVDVEIISSTTGGRIQEGFS